jgi:type I restriction enzyme S subunit
MPDRWEVRSLGDLCKINIGRTPSRDRPELWTRTDLSRPFCTIADMRGRKVRPVREGVTPLAVELGQAKRVPAGGLLMSFKLTLGRIGFADVDLYPNEAIAWLEPDPAQLRLDFLGFALEAVDFDALASDAAKGKTLNKKSLAQIQVPVPPLEEQCRIADLLQRVQNAADLAVEVAVSVRQLRAAVVSTAMADEPVEDHLTGLAAIWPTS